MERSRSTLLPGLAAHRRRRGLTQRQLGELAGVAHTTVQRLESLSRGAYPQTLRKLATALGIAPEELLHRGSAKRYGARPWCSVPRSNHPSPNTLPRVSREQAIHE
jgi:transcriptional regulator with XRE-family HTH domain